jgi:hypothetical protein
MPLTRQLPSCLFESSNGLVQRVSTTSRGPYEWESKQISSFFQLDMQSTFAPNSQPHPLYTLPLGSCIGPIDGYWDIPWQEQGTLLRNATTITRRG